MTMGTGVVLFVIGAILTFAVNLQNSFISLTIAGEILMAAGVITFVIGLVFALRGRRSVTTSSTAPNAAGGVTREATTSSDTNVL